MSVSFVLLRSLRRKKRFLHRQCETTLITVIIINRKHTQEGARCSTYVTANLGTIPGNVSGEPLHRRPSDLEKKVQEGSIIHKLCGRSLGLTDSGLSRIDEQDPLPGRVSFVLQLLQMKPCHVMSEGSLGFTVHIKR